ncbi:unnamed protein product [Sphagnum tenellum]
MVAYFIMGRRVLRAMQKGLTSQSGATSKVSSLLVVLSFQGKSEQASAVHKITQKTAGSTGSGGATRSGRGSVTAKPDKTPFGSSRRESKGTAGSPDLPTSKAPVSETPSTPI